MADNNEITARSWFCTFNNPEQHGFEGTPQEICDKIVELWVKNKPTRSVAVSYCISANGLKHCHIVLEDTKKMRPSAVKKVFPAIHLEVTKGNKEQAENYINKVGKFAEKGEEVITTSRYGEIKACQGQRKDFEVIEELIQQGLTPKQIFAENFAFRKHEKLVKSAFFDKRYNETSSLRDVSVYWHCGESGSGKTYTYVKLCELYGEDNVYLINDYNRGGFDNYNGEPILCMDEFRGQLPFSLLMQILDRYKTQIPCRYTNAYMLWNEVHIFTVLPPEYVFKQMVTENKSIDSYEQLRRRITKVIYHFKNNQDEYCSFEFPIELYKNYKDLKEQAEATDDLPF